MSNKNLTVWAFQHVGYEGLGSFEDILNEMNADIRYICGKRESLKGLDASDPDIMIVLGGPMGLYEADKYPYLLDEVELVRERINSKKPLLGICLGAQIIAQALGSKAFRGEAGQEIGWYPIYLNEAAQETPLRHLDHTKTNMMHWHSDTFELPEGVVYFGGSDLYKNQAYRFEDHVWAVQCHPEITPRKLELWYEADTQDLLEVPGLTVDKLREDADRYGQTLKKQARLFFTEWVEQMLKL